MSYAPVLLFVYNRPMHTRRLIESLLTNAEAARTPLVIYADAARDEAGQVAVEEVRRFIHTIEGFASVEIIERQTNWGLARSIIDGVTTQVNRYGRVIVLEDDLVVASHFLAFMNDALELFKDEGRIGHIHACDFTQNPLMPETFFIKWTGSWGWGTWARAWKLFNPDGQALMRELKERRLTRAFDFDGCYPYTKMLQRQIDGKNNSWAIRWNASLFLRDVLSLNVGKALVKNTGFDGSGTHCGDEELYASSLYQGVIKVDAGLPVKENLEAKRMIGSYYRKTISLKSKIVRRLQRMLRRVHLFKGK